MENRSVSVFRKMTAAAVMVCVALAMSFVWTGENAYAAGTSPTSAETITLGQKVTGTFAPGVRGDAYHYYKFKTKNLKGVKYVLRASNDYVEDDVNRRIEYSIIDSDYLDSEDVVINTPGSASGYYANGSGFVMYLWYNGEVGTMQYNSLKKDSWHYAKIRFYNYDAATQPNQYSFQIVAKKVTNPLKATGKTVKASKSKTKKFAVSKVISFKNKGKGKLSYSKASGNKKITINKKTGKVTVKKGLKKGTYKLKVKVKAAGNADYAAGTKKVTITIKVK